MGISPIVEGPQAFWNQDHSRPTLHVEWLEPFRNRSAIDLGAIFQVSLLSTLRQFPINPSSRPEMNFTQPAPIVPSPSGPFGDGLRSERQSARFDLLQLQTADDVLGHAARNPHASRSACLSVPSLSAGGHHPAGLRP